MAEYETSWSGDTGVPGLSKSCRCTLVKIDDEARSLEHASKVLLLTGASVVVLMVARALDDV